MYTKNILVLLITASITLQAQQKSSRIFSHNDYLQNKPFETAYTLGVGYIEADVFLRGNELMVAHTGIEIRNERTLQSIYFNPLKRKIQANGGLVYSTDEDTLTLMIDLKTEGISTLNAIVTQLKSYPELISCKTLTIAISGNVPDTSQWVLFPSFINFDGRPDRHYTEKHQQRISFVSNNFRNYSSWNGKGEIPKADVSKLNEVIASVHKQKKKIRFWGAPDVPEVWDTLMDLGVDILGTDKIEELSNHLMN